MFKYVYEFVYNVLLLYVYSEAADRQCLLKYNSYRQKKYIYISHQLPAFMC